MLTLSINVSKFFSLSCLKGSYCKLCKCTTTLHHLSFRPRRPNRNGTVISYAFPTIRYTTNHTVLPWSVGYLTQATWLRPHCPTFNQYHLYPLLVASSPLENQQRFAISCFRSVYPHERCSSWFACIKKHYAILAKDNVTCCNKMTNWMVHISYKRISLPVTNAKWSLQRGSSLEGCRVLSTGIHLPTFRRVVRVEQSKKPWTGWPWGRRELQSVTTVSNRYQSTWYNVLEELTFSSCTVAWFYYVHKSFLIEQIAQPVARRQHVACGDVWSEKMSCNTYPGKAGIERRSS